MKGDGRITLLTLQILAISFLVLLGCASTRQWKITGCVYDQEGKPLEGAKVSLKGPRLYHNGISKQDGRFLLTTPARNRGCSLTVNIPGYTELSLLGLTYHNGLEYNFSLALYPSVPIPPLSGFGMLAGNVIDGETGESIPGVSVILERFQLGSSTMMDGNYRVINIPSGNYNVIAKVPGYLSVRYAPIPIVPDSITYINFKLYSIPMTNDIPVIIHGAMSFDESSVLSRWRFVKCQTRPNPVKEVDDLLKVCRALNR